MHILAISPASDIILDVINAADPSSVREAHRALTQKAANGTQSASIEFSIARDGGAAARTGRGALSPADDAMKTYRDFEAMVLQTFVKSMLPQDAEEIFGEGTAGEIWKGMMAEHLGRMISEGGGIGIAEQLAPDGARVTAEGRLVSPHTPDAARDRATMMLEELQRTTLNDWKDIEGRERSEAADNHA